jgi:Leucine-rich repeat (LRR) protein
MAGISLILQNNPNVTAINCGTSSPRLGGTIDLSQFANLTEFICQGNDVTSIAGHTTNNNLIKLDFDDNKVTGSIPIYPANSALTYLNCQGNPLTGPIPSLLSFPNLTNFYCANCQLSSSIPPILSHPNLKVFYCSDNQLTGSIPALPSSITHCTFYNNQLTGPIPSVSGSTNLSLFYCFGNGLTGSIPSLNGLTKLMDFRCQGQTGVTKLRGSIPSLNDNNSLILFACSANELTGSIPNLTNNIKLESFYCDRNQLTGFAGGSVSNTLGQFEAYNNQLTSTVVNNLLSAFVAAGRTTGTPIVNGTCILNLGGAGNFRPTGQGVTDVTTLRGRGWTVTTGIL